MSHLHRVNQPRSTIMIRAYICLLPHKPRLPFITMVAWVMLLFFSIATPAGARQWFISPAGNDSNAGTNQTAPVQSWSRANALLSPGDTLVVLDGTYGIGSITKSGTANAWITVQAQNPGVPIIALAATVTKLIPPNQYPNATNAWVWEQDCFDLISVAYVKVTGLTCLGFNPINQIVSSGHGINIQGSHHIVIQNCRVSGCSGNGIDGNPYYWSNGSQVTGPLDFITIADNVVSGCGFWNQYQCSGISMWEARDAGLGNDPSGYNISIRRNISYANQNKIGAWGQTVDQATDGEGIIIDTFTALKYPHATLVDGNLCYGNGGRGIEAVNSDNVTVRYNTLYHNNQNNLQGTWLQGELQADGTDNFLAEDNIAIAGAHSGWQAAVTIHSFGATNTATLKNNLFFGDPGYAPRELDSFPYVTLTETNTLAVDPQFVLASTNPATANFSLRTGSPAIDAATASPAPNPDLAGTPRPQGAGYERGAYEYQPAMPYVSRAQRLSSTNFMFQLNGVFGSNYTILYATNVSAPLTNWSRLMVTNLATSPAVIQDTHATNRQRFYRVLLGP